MHGPRDLVAYARRAEEAGFPFAMISDHFHPWVERQGHSPHVWSVIGAIATTTERLRLGTGVTCPAEQARRTALEWWPNAAIPGELGQVLPQPAHFEQAAQLVTEERIAESIACGPDPEVHLDFVRRYVAAGYDHVFLHQVGPDQDGFISFCERELLPQVGQLATA
jgi:hypothetical protein